MYRLQMTALALPLVIGCGEMTITGTILNGEGAPISDATVTAKGTECAATSSQDGQFRITCEPGTHTLVISKAGYLSESFSLEAQQRQEYPSGSKVLSKLPQDTGLFLFTNRVTRTLSPGNLVRRHEGKGLKKTRSYCLDQATSEPNVLKPGMTPLLDHQARAWRPFRLDAEGCAYRDARNERGSWVVEYREKPDIEEKKISESMSIARIQLKPGQYFIANWKGFFEANKGEKQDTYGGYWLTVEP